MEEPAATISRVECWNQDDSEFEKKYDTLSKGYLPFRINHWSWWKQELPSKEEMEEGRQNLEKHDNKVDFIVTHS